MKAVMLQVGLTYIDNGVQQVSFLFVQHVGGPDGKAAHVDVL